MTITSKGYARAINYKVLGELIASGGAQYSVVGPNAFSLSDGPGDRELRMTSGRALGYGIIDDSDATESLFADIVASGSRWDLVALRRTWGSSTTVPVLIKGTAAKQIPATRVHNPGVTDDHPLFLARFDAGKTKVQEIVDLRVWHGTGGAVATDPLVRSFLDTIGTQVTIANVLWQLGRTPLGAPTWINPGTDWGNLTGKPASFPSTSHDVQMSGRGNLSLEQFDAWIRATINNPAFTQIWTGAWFMTDTQSISLATGKRLSDQGHGFLLCWSSYAGGAANNDIWSTTFVPKSHLLTPGSAFQCLMGGDSNPPGGGILVTKKLYITDTKISGSGINNDNAAANRVLRYVFGF